MSDWPQRRTLTADNGKVISTTQSLLGLINATASSTAWPSGSRALFIPVRVPYPVTVYKMVIGAGATAAGNFDVGIYDRFGNRLVSSGATAKGASVEHILDVTDTVIGPGMYYFAMAADGTNNYMLQVPNSVQKTRAFGVLQMASAYPLPDPATFAAVAGASFPIIAALLMA